MAYSSQGNHSGQVDFCNRLADANRIIQLGKKLYFYY